MKEPDGREAPQLVCERRVRIVSKADARTEQVFALRVWRLPKGTPAVTTPSWMYTYRVEDGYKRRSSDMTGFDEVHALGHALAWIDDILTMLSSHHDIWIGENPEYPYTMLKDSTPKRLPPEDCGPLTK